jgi:hypothetical protein
MAVTAVVADSSGLSQLPAILGSLTMSYNGTDLATANLGQLAGGERGATVSTKALPVGRDLVTLTYNPDSGHLPASTNFYVVVAQPTTYFAGWTIDVPGQIGSISATVVVPDAVTAPFNELNEIGIYAGHKDPFHDDFTAMAEVGYGGGKPINAAVTIADQHQFAVAAGDRIRMTVAENGSSISATIHDLRTGATASAFGGSQYLQDSLAIGVATYDRDATPIHMTLDSASFDGFPIGWATLQPTSLQTSNGVLLMPQPIRSSGTTVRIYGRAT